MQRSSNKEVVKVPFNEEEVNKTLLKCCGDKASGLDGKTMALLWSNWDVVHQDVMTLFFGFFSSEKFLASVNVIFTGLAPKKATYLLGCICKLP